MTSLRKNISVIALACLMGATAFAGKEGHGGNAVVCRDQAGKIKSAELLDLFEGHVIYRLKIQSSPLPIQLQLHGILNRIWAANKDMAAYMEPLFRQVSNNKTVLQDGVELAPVDDAFPTVIPTNCKIEQLANYVNDQEILVDGAIWKALDLTNQAALIVHESLYKFLRSFGDTDSRRTRRIVAYLFSDFTFDDVYGGIPAQSQMCQSQFGEHYYKFFVYTADYTDQNGVHQMPHTQFIWIDGQPQFSKKTGWAGTPDGNFPPGLNTYVTGDVVAGSALDTNFEKGDLVNSEFTALDHGNVRMEISGLSGADPDRQYAKTQFSCQPFPAVGPAPQPQANLSVVGIPNNPILIPNGSILIDNYFPLTGPYFIMNQLQILWPGTGSAQVTGIRFRSLDPKVAVDCSFVGSDLTVLYPQDVSNGEFNGQVVFAQGSSAHASQALGCKVKGLPNPLPDTNIDVPIEIEVDGLVDGPDGYRVPSVATTIVHMN